MARRVHEGFEKGENFVLFIGVLIVLALFLILILSNLDFWNCHKAPGEIISHCHSLFTPAHTH